MWRTCLLVFNKSIYVHHLNLYSSEHSALESNIKFQKLLASRLDLTIQRVFYSGSTCDRYRTAIYPNSFPGNLPSLVLLVQEGYLDRARQYGLGRTPGPLLR